MEISFNFFKLAALLLVNYLFGHNSAKTSTNISTDQSSLLALKSHITSDPYNIFRNNWTTKTSVCSWTGITCSSHHHRVTALDISNMGLEGTIPSEIGNLTFLLSINMSRNLFHKNLPKELSHMRRLKVIDFSWNNFTGELPKALFGSLSQLEFLHLYGNSLEGIIPEQIGNLHKLKDLRLQNNNLNGSIPATIFNISSLEFISLRNNSLSGSLPEEICSQNHPRLRGLDLSRNMFYGEIPSSLFRCSLFELLSLARNKFSGLVPREIGNLTDLKGLYLGFNSLRGPIPQEISHIRNLQELGMENNTLTGFLPPAIFNISSLQYLSFAYNGLSGSIPREIGNSTLLKTIYLSYNNFTGEIPQEIGNVYELERLNGASNSLTGSLPLGIFNMSKLIVISLDRNHLSGNLPTTRSYNLPNLEELYLGTNDLKGQILNSITNSPKLTVLQLDFNKFSGSIPKSLSNLTLLRILNLNGNNFTSDPSSGEMSFITSLTNCRYLAELQLSNNPLNGILPPTIGNFSKSLKIVLADNCRIKGSIPSEIGNLSSLQLLSLMKNELTGDFPMAIQGLQELERLFLGVNQLTGAFPYSICTFQNLGAVDLTSNQISGPIPECIGNITYLRELDLSSNKLDSSIPESVWHHQDLLNLDLSSNFLSGYLSPKIGNLQAAIVIDLSGNVFSGVIPSTIGSLQSLVRISLANNQFHGSIPESMSDMLSLELLDLSQNNLSGVIPKSLDTLKYLIYFNVSFNDLSGEIPSDGPFRNLTDQSFILNKGLCGAPRFNVPPCHIKSVHKSRKLQVIFVSLGVSIAVIATAVVLVLLKYQKKNQTTRPSDLLSPLRQRRISIYELQQATEGYNESNLLGTGGLGAVYKGVLRDGTVLAVKVFNLQVDGAMKSFNAECEVFRNLRHRNIARVISSCSNNSFKALVLDYMPKGSLERWLYSHNYFLNIMQRLDIMIDVASAVDYLHHGYSTPVIHCDLKPSNVLLDEDMVAHVSDFGMAKLLGEEDSATHTRTLATLGYMAPEYGMEGIASQKSDVYSYGIMLMEVFTRTKPSDERFVGDMTLKRWVTDSLPNALQQIVDSNLLDPNGEDYRGNLDCLTHIMELAISCTAESPRERISMKDVLSTLKKIKVELLACI